MEICNKSWGGGCSKLSLIDVHHPLSCSVSPSYILIEAVAIKSRSVPKWAINGAVSELESLSTVKITNKDLLFLLASNWITSQRDQTSEGHCHFSSA